MKPTEARQNVFQKYEKLGRKLKKLVYDQDEAIDEVIDAFIHMACKPVQSPPRAIFTFIGPPYVGKAYLARSLAALMDDYTAFRQFDMGQYTTPEDETRLLGQVGYDGGQDGELMVFLRSRPRSILLFNEIEKADTRLQNALLEILTGDPQETGLDCSEVLVIFTSTLGSAMYQSRAFMTAVRENRLQAQALIMDAVSKEKKMGLETVQPVISTKLLSVMSQAYLVIFRRLSLDAVVKIGKTTLKTLSRHFSRTTGIELVFEGFVPMVKLLVLSFAPYINTRRIQKRLPDLLLGQITQYVREGHPIPGKAVFRISKAAGTFLKRHYRLSITHSQQLFIRNETIELGWDVETGDDAVTFTLARVARKQLPPAKPLFQDDLPEIKFSATGFDDVAGHGPVKKHLREIISILKKTDKVKAFGIGMPKGMLIHGPAGVGKTLLGKAFAREANLPLVYVSGSDLFDPNFIRQVYQKARVFAPSIVFLDEIDIKGVVEGTLTPISVEQILMELEAVSSDPAEFVFTIVTAQNREDVNPDLVSPGRIDISVEVPELDREARRFFIEKILEKPNDGNIDVDKVIRYISGMSGYELERIGQEAAFYAIRNDLDCITEEILIDQINTIKYGSKLDRKHIRNIEEDLRKTAIHEAAHAVISQTLLPHVKIEQVTITPRSNTLGFVAYTGEDFDDNFTKEEIFNNICVMLSGRIAQIRKFGPSGMDSGSGIDLEQATQLAYSAVAGMGMDEEIGFVHVDTLQHHVEKTMFQGILEKRIQHWIGDASAKAGMLVEKHWDRIEHLASVLIQQEIVDGAELDVLMKGD
ncbi:MULTISPECIES: AAA family ATPase [Desulfococcus]|jgi:ATP-dependent Zn protease|uniref:Peptidase M41 n=1 Tax=Desulfococcus multivorans DSM 2059 TaxID=1121405 RepID=S7UUL6_DESML|nr:AAA family ATPase [Desulfococcus multivorans]AOY58709.1 ATP-dependent peptidase, M41 family [Desulfococcus multivorans]AQX36462.1 hypothetical protein B2D07_19895 [Desulfococcus multivorans]EPR37739.1 peptidase M41 [Desulfococcus multivorans DSM 2059]MDX9818956.1 AAA family ATPase [Desulfococcus multivorans]SJZ46804.1 ATP-dependent Zn proteases [Desulfococcus multivorans DSM 2059]